MMSVFMAVFGSGQRSVDGLRIQEICDKTQRSCLYIKKEKPTTAGNPVLVNVCVSLAYRSETMVVAWCGQLDPETRLKVYLLGRLRTKARRLAAGKANGLFNSLFRKSASRKNPPVWGAGQFDELVIHPQMVPANDPSPYLLVFLLGVVSVVATSGG